MIGYVLGTRKERTTLKEVIMGSRFTMWYLKMSSWCVPKEYRIVLDCQRDLEYFCIIINSAMQWLGDGINNFGFIEGLFRVGISV